ncbi:MAG: PP2C family protein-serine/threonine phosphatase [Acidobacteriia bacterium]|nr:PP2C family protein-serine/threonine phosphatase [Terriglobia bacterium]
MYYKNLFRKLEKTLATLERSEDLVGTLAAILGRLVNDFQDDLGIVGGRIYVRHGSHYVLETEFPPGKAPLGFRIPVSYRPIQEILDRGFVLKDITDPGIDREIERAIGVSVFAAIRVGEKGRQIMAFSLKHPAEADQVVYTLNTIRHVVNLKVRQEHLEGRVAEAREIQLSLLPLTSPAFGPFDLHGASVPAEEVGGDLYDFIPVSSRRIGIAIADSSGHGLPAALQARDAIIGLRMGVEEQLRLTATIEKLNRVVSHSALASKFISLFYGELELNGTLVYCNAGHTPPLLRARGGVEELTRGGTVLGPNPDARYERGYVDLPPGSALLAYTDGISEAESAAGEAFGVERLREVLASERWASARNLVEKVFGAVKEFSLADPPVDDQTVVAVVRR